MTVAIDPSETRHRPAARKRDGSARRRVILLSGIGGLALVAFTAGAFSFFSGLADPRANRVRVASVAASWPDLKDGVPALVSETGAGTAPKLSLPASPPKPLRSEPQQTERVAAPPESQTAARSVPARPEPVQDAPQGASAKRLPPIEPVALVTTADPAPLVATARTASPLAPLKTETVRAKAIEPSSFVSLSPADAPPEAPEPAPAKRKAVQPARAANAAPASPVAPRPAAAPKPAVREASAQPAAAEADEDTEIFGVKIPSLAPAGRKLREGMEALGEAVVGKPQD